MSYIRTIIAALVFSLLFMGAAFAREVPTSFADVVEPVIPAVVNISTTARVKPTASNNMGAFPFPGMEDDPQLAPFKELFKQFGGGGMQPRAQKVTSLGSGFVISDDGYIVTNNHVVQEASDIMVTFHDDTKLPAKLVGRDAKTDLALLKVKTTKKLSFVALGDSDKLRVGDWVVAVGNPFGLGGTVTAGIVSARGRNINAGAYDDFIQTDAAINRGNSGGPLFNMNGEVVGINSAIFSPTGTNIGIGFSVPTSLAKPVLDQLKATGHITRGWLGVKIQPVTDEIADSLNLKEVKGAMVLDVTKDGPAAKAGIQSGDVILKFAGQDVTSSHTLPRMVADAKVGSNADVTLWRKGSEKRISVKLVEMPKDVGEDKPGGQDDPDAGDAQSGSAQVLGLMLKPLTPTLKKQFGIDDKATGLLVTGVDDESDAADKGIRAGDIVTEANQQTLTSTNALKDLVAAAKKSGRGFVLLRVMRGDDSVMVTIPVK